MNYSKATLGIIAAFSFFNSAIAQTEIQRDSSSTLNTEVVEVRKAFLPTISEAYKISYEPKLVNVKVPKVSFNYDFLPKEHETTFKADTIKAARIKGEPLDKLYRAILTGGIGNYETTYGTFHLNNLRSRNNLYGLKLYHHGSAGNVKDLPESGYNKNGAQLSGKKFLKAHAVGLSAGYDRELVHFYGLDDELRERVDFADFENKQIYQEISAKAEFQSFFADSNRLNYDLKVNYFNFRDDYSNEENQVVFNSKLEKYFGKELAQVFVNVDYNDHKLNSPNIITEINPQIKANGKNWNFSAGLKAFIEREDDTKFRFYPNVSFNYNVLENLVVPYAGITGGVSRNNNNSLRKTNPFIGSPLDLVNTNTRYNVYGGVRGAYSSTISFNLQASKKQLANMPLFVNFENGLSGTTTPSTTSFNTIYDTINITQLTGELGYIRSKKFNLLARLDYYSYDPNNEAKAWHLPNVKATATGKYNIQNKISLATDIFYVSSRYAKSLDRNDERLAAGVYGRKLDGYVDANLRIRYNYNKKWSLFINFNNLAAQNIEQWNHYDSQRFNILAGFSYGFWGK